MMMSFVLLVHVPMVISAKPDAMHLSWIMLFVASMLTASAWAVAAHVADRGWGLK